MTSDILWIFDNLNYFIEYCSICSIVKLHFTGAKNDDKENFCNNKVMKERYIEVQA